MDDIYLFLADWPVGRPVKLTIVRGQERVELEVVPVEAT